MPIGSEQLLFQTLSERPGRLRAVDDDGVIDVRKVTIGEENVHVGIAGTDSNDRSRVGEELDEIGLEIDDEVLIRNKYTTPYSGFDGSPDNG
ncbi:hypothetical protein [Salinibaculum salinum]|uniref:hypothetical protein n=1 Tax=Salinibaculum salinum TaxID=3131996 RepID=UPI0030EDD027